MSYIVPITKERHASKKWRHFTNYGFAAQLTVAPIVEAELASAALSLPLALTQNNNSFTLVAVLSMVPNRNMLVAPDGRWLGAYIPAHLRAHPFLYLPKERVEETIVGIDESSGLVVSANEAGEEFFASDGTLSSALQRVVDFLADLDRKRRQTDASVAALAEANLVEPWPIAVKSPAGEQKIGGLYRVNAAALDALPDSGFLKLRQALPLAYSQILSMGTLKIFERLAHVQHQLRPVPTQALPENLDSIFGLQDDNIIKF
jgi:SapC